LEPYVVLKLSEEIKLECPIATNNLIEAINLLCLPTSNRLVEGIVKAAISLYPPSTNKGKLLEELTQAVLDSQ
jgi:hypothetical protein